MYRNAELLFLGYVVASAVLGVVLTSTTGQRITALAIVGLAVIAGVVLRMLSEELPGWPPRRRSSSSLLTTVVLLVLAFGSALLVSGGSPHDHLGAWVAGFAAGITLASPVGTWMDWQRWVV